MSEKLQKHFQSPWKTIAYNYEKYADIPGLPSDYDCERFLEEVNEVIKRNNLIKPKVLVLGSTPLLRDYMAKIDCEVTCIDINTEMFECMSKMCTHDKNETFVEGNWLKMPFENNTFDAIVGDIVLSQFDKEHEPVFLAEVKRILKTNGAFIHRMFFIPNNWDFPSTKELLKIFEDPNYGICPSGELHFMLVTNTFDKEKYEISNLGVKKELEPYWNGEKYSYPNKRVEDALNRIKDMWSPFDKVWGAETRDEAMETISEFFEITKEFPGKGHLIKDVLPIVVCVPK